MSGILAPHAVVIQIEFAMLNYNSPASSNPEGIGVCPGERNIIKLILKYVEEATTNGAVDCAGCGYLHLAGRCYAKEKRENLHRH